MSSYTLHHLNDETRKHMLSEFNNDLSENKLYISSRLTDQGISYYPEYLRQAILSGDSESFQSDLDGIGHFNPTYLRQGKPVKMPSNAANLLASSEFNRYYIRGVCLNAIENGSLRVQIYRARESTYVRADSEARIGLFLDANELVNDLRITIGLEPHLLPEINSGLSVRF
jgi:hypothetical protein